MKRGKVQGRKGYYRGSLVTEWWGCWSVRIVEEEGCRVKMRIHEMGECMECKALQLQGWVGDGEQRKVENGLEKWRKVVGRAQFLQPSI